MPNKAKVTKPPQEERWEPVHPAGAHSSPKPEEPRFPQPKEPVKRTKGDEPSRAGCDL